MFLQGYSQSSPGQDNAPEGSGEWVRSPVTQLLGFSISAILDGSVDKSVDLLLSQSF